ncbi:unnamed protein product [Gordionus sp. m RMFG-2023]
MANDSFCLGADTELLIVIHYNIDIKSHIRDKQIPYRGKMVQKRTDPETREFDLEPYPLNKNFYSYNQAKSVACGLKLIKITWHSEVLSNYLHPNPLTINRCIEEGPESISSMINPIREDADFESISRNEEIVTSVINHEQEDGGAVGISGILEEGPESISSMINPIREDADFESISRNEEIVTSVINHEQEDGGAVGISGILEEGPESISSMINPIREDADFG